MPCKEWSTWPTGCLLLRLVAHAFHLPGWLLRAAVSLPLCPRVPDAREVARSGNNDGDADDDGAWEDALTVDTEFAGEVEVPAELSALAASLPPGHDLPIPMYRTDPGWRAAARAGLAAARRFVEEYNHENSGTTAADGPAPMWMMPTKPHTDIWTIPWDQAQQYMPTAEQCGEGSERQPAAAAAAAGEERSRSRSRSRKGRK